MPILDKWDLILTPDEVRRAQAADPETIRVRRPALVRVTEEAITRGKPLLQPKVLYKKYRVDRFIHDRLELEHPCGENGSFYLSGQLIGQHLAKAQEVILMLCTIGSELDNTVSSLFKLNPVDAVALDGVGSAAVEMLAIQACNHFEKQ